MMDGRMYNTGKHMWRYGEPAIYDQGKVTHRRLGPCPSCGYPTTEYGGGFSCNNDMCKNSRYVFVCHTPDKWPTWWGEDVFFMLDGNKWCAFEPDFINLQESAAGFGDTPDDAYVDYRKQLLKQKTSTAE